MLIIYRSRLVSYDSSLKLLRPRCMRLKHTLTQMSQCEKKNKGLCSLRSRIKLHESRKKGSVCVPEMFVEQWGCIPSHSTSCFIGWACQSIFFLLQPVKELPPWLGQDHNLPKSCGYHGDAAPPHTSPCPPDWVVPSSKQCQRKRLKQGFFVLK